MTIAWPNKPPPTPDVVNGLTARYPCKTLSSVDVHLNQMRRRMYERAAQVDTTVLAEMASLLADRDALLELRLAIVQALKRP